MGYDFPTDMSPIKINRHTFFVAGIILKALNAVVEIALGVLVLLTAKLVTFVDSLASQELIEDPNDFLASHFQQFLYPLLHAHTFVAIYLLSHGVIKLVLAAGLLRRDLWAYPTALGVFFLFIVYQTYRFTITHSVFLIVLTVFDLIIIWLTWKEYQALKHHLASTDAVASA